MSESLAPDPKPSCCLQSPMGTCEQHATYSVEEMMIMELDRRVRSVAADIRAVRDGGCHIDRADLDHWVAMLEGQE